MRSAATLASLCGALTIGLASSSPASAANWTVDCLSRQLPAAENTAQPQPLSRSDQTRREAAAAACGVTPAEKIQAQKAYRAYTSARSALDSLSGSHGVTKAKALDAWAALPAADRSRFVAIAPTMHKEPQSIALFESLVSQMAQKLNLTSAPATGQLKQLVYNLAILQSMGRGSVTR